MEGYITIVLKFRPTHEDGVDFVLGTVSSQGIGTCSCGDLLEIENEIVISTRQALCHIHTIFFEENQIGTSILTVCTSFVSLICKIKSYFFKKNDETN